MSLMINLATYEKKNIFDDQYYIRSYRYENYLSIKSNEPQIMKYDDDFTNELNCLYDVYNSLIKCIYVYALNSRLYLLVLKESDNSIIYVKEIKIDGNAIFDLSPNYKIISFSLSGDIDFICVSDNGKTKCFFKNKSSDGFNIISKNFENECSELKTFYFDEKN